MTSPDLKALIKNLLSDDEGIAPDVYSSLLDYLDHVKDYNLVREVSNCVKSNNGRYYFPQKISRKHEDHSPKDAQREKDYEYNWKDPNNPQNW